MKIKLSFSVLTFILCLSLFGCRVSIDSGMDSEQNSVTQQVCHDYVDSYGRVEFESPCDAYNPLTGNSDMARDRVGMRPFAVDINNIYTCWPQYGISQADILYEFLTEGGITRFMAVFSDVRDVPRIGSVRSLRNSAMDGIYQLDPIVVHCGIGGAKADEFLRHYAVRTVSSDFCPSGFWRDKIREQTYSPEHCLFTSGRLINNALIELPLIKHETTNPPQYSAFNFAKGNSERILLTDGSAKNIKCCLTGYAYLEYVYDSTTGKYLRSEFGEPQTDANSGAQLAFDNVFVLYYTPNNDRANRFCFVDDFAKYEQGYYFSNGTYQHITWSKQEPKRGFVFLTDSGDELVVNKGTTCISLAQNEYIDKMEITD
ncbi:MAG: DUF3048 domain-containing protein [Oscillospiraceae bacterium]